jgi:hypothetical protein
MENNEIVGNSNLEFKEIINNKFKDLFWQALSYLEISHPHTQGDGSDNEKIYNTLRSKILRIGNDAIRSNDDLFKSFVVFKLYEYKLEKNENVKTDIYNFKSKFKIGKGEKND